MIDGSPTHRSLIEAKAWCQLCLSDASGELFPETLARCNLHESMDRQSSVQQAVEARRTMLLGRAAGHGASLAALAKSTRGRVLCFWLDVYLFEALERDECNGFLDERAIAPTETWIACLQTGVHRGEPCWSLLSWVPERFVAGIQAAINVNTTGCLQWLADIKRFGTTSWLERVRLRRALAGHP